MAKRFLPLLILSFGVTLAVAGFFLIGFHCSYGFISTIMTGRVTFPGIWSGLPYRWVLSVAVYLILYASFAWGQEINSKCATNLFADPSLLMVLSVGVAVLGFLASYYPCPVSMDLWLLLMLEVSLGVVSVPYGAILALAIVLLLCAVYARAQQKRAAN